MTASAELTADTLAVNPALVAADGTVTSDGTATAGLLLASLMVAPCLSAGAPKVTVHASFPGPVIEVVAQAILLSPTAVNA